MAMPLPPSDPPEIPGLETPDTGLGLLGLGLGDLGRLLLVIVTTLALVSLAVVLITAGLLNLLGLGPGDALKLTPPGRAGTMAEVAVSARKG